jgi:hypothetical protein
MNDPAEFLKVYPLADMCAAAQAADDAFSAAVKAAGFKSRWDCGVHACAAITPSRLAKYAADNMMQKAFAASREVARAERNAA